MWQTWWLWVAGGVALGVVELLVPGYVFLGFAIGAVLTGALVWLGVSGPLPVTFVLFGGLSLLSWWLMRRILGRRAGDVKIITRDINEN